MLNIPKKRGFKSHREKPTVVNFVDLMANFEDGATINPKALLAKGLIGKIKGRVKILGKGKLNKKFHFEKCLVSLSAKERIEKLGGSIKE